MCHKSIYMAPLTEKQQQAYGLFFNTDKNSTEIADILDVNRKTVYLWIKNGKWAEMKRAANVAPGMILLDVYGHIGAINNKIRQREPDDRIPTMEEVEKLRKLLGMVKNINKNHIGAYMESFTELVRFIGGTDEVLSWKVAEYAKRYVRGNFGDMEFETSVKSKKQVAWVKENLAAEEERETELSSERETERRAEVSSERETERRAEGNSERERERRAEAFPGRGTEGIDEEELELEPEMQVENSNDNWEYGTIWGDDGAMMGQREATEFYNHEVLETATVANLELVGENSGSGFSTKKIFGAFGAMTTETEEECEEETRHNNIMKQAEALAAKFGYTLPAAKPKPKNEFELTINGYWTEDNVYGLPDIPGIYAMYECETDKKTYYTKPIKLLAIGESHNIKADVYQLLKNTLDTENPNRVTPQPGWRGVVPPGHDICFSYIKCEFSDLNRLATALIENINPPFNKPLTQFNYPKTTIVTFGQNLLFPKVISKQNLAA